MNFMVVSVCHRCHLRPAEDVMCNTKMQNCSGQVVRTDTSTVVNQNEQGRHEGNMTLNVKKDAGLRTEMQMSKHTSRFFWAKRTYEALTPLTASGPWVKTVWFIFLNLFEDVSICSNVLSVFVDWFSFEAAFTNLGLFLPFHSMDLPLCAFGCFHLQSLFSPLLFTVSDIYKDKICCAISLKAPWDTPHLERCSLKSLLTVVCFYVCVFERM